MIRRETGILNPLRPDLTEVAQSMGAYKFILDPQRGLSFGVLGFKRRALAQKAIENGDEPAPLQKFPSRIPPTAHWAEDEDATRRRMVAVNTLYHTVNHYGGQVVMRFAKGTYADLEQRGPDSPELKIQVARLEPEAQVYHRIKAAGPDRLPASRPNLPYAHYASFMPILPDIKVIRRRNGRVRVLDQQVPAGLLVAHDGVTSLHPDPTLYHETVTETPSTLLFGNYDAYVALEHLTGNPIDFPIFSKAGPMPDLSFLAEPQPAVTPAPAGRDLNDVLQDIGSLVD